MIHNLTVLCNYIYYLKHARSEASSVLVNQYLNSVPDFQSVPIQITVSNSMCWPHVHIVFNMFSMVLTALSDINIIKSTTTQHCQHWTTELCFLRTGPQSIPIGILFCILFYFFPCFNNIIMTGHKIILYWQR